VSGNPDLVLTKHDGAIGIADFTGGLAPIEGEVWGGAGFAEKPLDPHDVQSPYQAPEDTETGRESISDRWHTLHVAWITRKESKMLWIKLNLAFA
jgi:hypothetical protein